MQISFSNRRILIASSLVGQRFDKNRKEAMRSVVKVLNSKLLFVVSVLFGVIRFLNVFKTYFYIIGKKTHEIRFIKKY